MKIVNPNWKSAIHKKAEQHAQAVSEWLAANSQKKVVTLEELRAGLPSISGDLSRLVVNQICAFLGLEIQEADTQEI
jgi:hypothetical protein